MLEQMTLSYDGTNSLRGYKDIPQGLNVSNAMVTYIPYTTVSYKISGPPLLSETNNKLSVKVNGSNFTASETVTVLIMWFYK